MPVHGKKETKLSDQFFLSWGIILFFERYNTVLQNYGNVCALGKVGKETCFSLLTFFFRGDAEHVTVVRCVSY